MKLALTVNKPPNGHAFQPNDKVEGRIEVQLAEGMEAPDIRVVFQGTAKISLKPGFDAVAQIAETHQRQSVKLFSSVQELHPTLEDRSAADSPSRQTCAAVFSFPFPPYARCCRSSLPAKPSCRLPPSTSISSAGLKVRVTYSVTAVCRRSGRFHHLLRNITARQLLNYAPPVSEHLNTPVGPSLVISEAEGQGQGQSQSRGQDHLKLIRSTAWLPAGKLKITTSTADAATSHNPDSAVLPPGCLPPYSPAMTLEVVMPYPPVITPGQAMALGLFVRTPRAFLTSGNRIQLRSITVRLRRQTYGRIGTSVRADVATWPIWSIKGTLPIRQERVDVACGSSWNELFSIPAVPPGFRSCFVSRTYSIDVTMGVSTDAAAAIQYVNTSVRVMVSEPPPAYGNEPCPGYT